MLINTMTPFNLEEAIELLEATPRTLAALLSGLSEEWTKSSDDRNNWGTRDIVGHLIHGEITDWIPRARIILEHGTGRTFDPFDRLAQFDRAEGESLPELLAEFAALRMDNIAVLRSWKLTERELSLHGSHPELGEVTLAQLLATWAVHDLNHIRQIATVMARRYRSAVGPWKDYLSILCEPAS